MSLSCQNKRGKVQNRSSVNIDKTTIADLRILSSQKGMSKKDIVQELVKKELNRGKGGRTH